MLTLTTNGVTYHYRFTTEADLVTWLGWLSRSSRQVAA